MSSVPRGVARPSSRCRRSASQAPPVRMPTRPVESVTPERSFPASSRQRASASGRFIQVALQNYFRGERVHVALVIASTPAPLAQRLARGSGTEPLVGEVHGEAEARFELSREAARAPRHLVLGAVHGKGQA